MNSILLRLFPLILVAATLQTGEAASYHAPNESKELFRLEKIPLQVYSMKEISEQLVVLVRSVGVDVSPSQQRAKAQQIALAMRLDPTNKIVREVNKALLTGAEIKSVSSGQVAKAKSKLRFYKKWLADPSAGKEANQLANYISDATKLLNPDGEDAKDVADWSGVLAPTKQPKIANAEDSKKSLPKVEPQPDQPKKTTPKPSDPSPKFHIDHLALKVPLKTEEEKKYTDPKDNSEKSKKITRYQITPVKIKITSDTKTKQFDISVSSSLSSEGERIAAAKRITSPVIKSVQLAHPSLPPATATVKVGLGKYMKSNHLVMTVPLAVMVKASLLNQPLRDDVVICASLKESGKIIEPFNFWKLFNIVRDSHSRGRLIISKESREVVTGLLVHEEADFFARWEVICVDTLDGAYQAAIQQSPDDYIKATELFATIQKLTGKTKIETLATNKMVRKRLQEILALNPMHFSASVLLLQGSSKCPRSLSERALAYEMLPILRSVIKDLDPKVIGKLPTAAKLKTIHAGYRGELDKVEPFIDRSSGDLYKETFDLVNGFRRLSVYARRIANADSSEKNGLTETAKVLIGKMQRSCEALILNADKLIVKKPQ